MGPSKRASARLKTRCWNDPVERSDGFRLLVCRYRPRGVRKADETWDAWWPHLGPSVELHAAFYGKRGAPLTWRVYRTRYMREMRSQTAAIATIAERVANSESVTLLCSSACTNEARCHRTLLKALIDGQS